MTAHQPANGCGVHCSTGADFVLWACRSIVDGYFPCSTRWATRSTTPQDVAAPEAHAFFSGDPLPAEARAHPDSGPMSSLRVARSSPSFSCEFGLISEPNTFYFRSVYDHLIRLNDELDLFRELVALPEDYLSTINNNLSDDHEAEPHRGSR